MVGTIITALVLCVPSDAAGFGVESGFTSFSGPDTYATLRTRLEAAPNLEVGVLGIAGTTPAWFGTVARTVLLAPDLYAKGELDLGMAREAGPVFGLGGSLQYDVDVLSIVGSARWVDSLGFQGDLGVDAPVSSRLTFKPRLRAETWAGDRDLALRIVLGSKWSASSRWWMGLEASAGGRDVLHMGPGMNLSFGRKP